MKSSRPPPTSPLSSVSAFFATAAATPAWRVAYAANVVFTVPFLIYAALHGLPATTHVVALPGQADVAAAHRFLFSGHSAAALVYAPAALIQFHGGLRKSHRRLHRASGYAFAAAAALLGAGGGTGLAANTYTRFPGGVLSAIGAALSLIFLVAGIGAARERRLADHRDWIIRHYGVTWGLVAGSRVLPVVMFPVALSRGVPEWEAMLGAWILSMLGGMVAAEVIIATTPRSGGAKDQLGGAACSDGNGIAVTAKTK
ncbi:hypothetical protein MMPV_000962 [Pyropia vietnamensis]